MVAATLLTQLKLPSFNRTLPGWLAIQVAGKGVSMCHVETTGEGPVVRLALDATERDLAELRRSMKLAAYQNLVVMPAGGYSLVQTEAPAVPRAEWRDALRWRLKELIDTPAESAIFDVADIPIEAYAPGRQAQCFVVAAQRDKVMDCVRPFHEAKVAIAAVDIPEMAQRNLAALFEEENRAVAFLYFGATSALLTVTFHGELYGSRRIEINAAQISGADESRRQQLLERVALETQRTLDAFDRQFSFMTVTRLILAVSPEYDGVLEALANNLYIPVVPMNLASVIDLSLVPELQALEAQMRFLPLIGAALRPEVGA